MTNRNENKWQNKQWRRDLHEIIFEADTKAGKLFDILILIMIIISVIVVLLDSVTQMHEKYGSLILLVEWGITVIFSIEYILRIISTKKVKNYIFSFYGIIDFLAIIPTYLSLFLVGSHYLSILRIIRLLRVFRVLKLARYIGASRYLVVALKESRHKIAVFLWVVFLIVIIMGSLMYIIEGPEHGFTSIPRSIYWAIVTLTTVGYGDIAPSTFFGQALASLIMITGYSIIAVPTGLVTAELIKTGNKKTNTQVCFNCSAGDHDDDAKFCKYCGTKL
jgi:voltage-gated potassium channel